MDHPVKALCAASVLVIGIAAAVAIVRRRSSKGGVDVPKVEALLTDHAASPPIEHASGPVPRRGDLSPQSPRPEVRRERPWKPPV